GIAADVLTTAAEAARKEGRTGWKLTLHMPCYLPVMQYADDRAIRERMYEAYFTRASELGPPAWDNAPVIERILQLRAEQAKLLTRRYSFSDQEVKPYFPEDEVLAGMFRLVETLYGLRIREAEAERYHPQVRFFEIADRQGARVGQFYLDLYAREGKRGGAW